MAYNDNELNIITESNRSKINGIKKHNIFEAFKQYHAGNTSVFDDYFYNYERFSNGHHKENQLRFSDFEIQSKIIELGQKLSQDKSIPLIASVYGRGFEFIANNERIESDEIIYYFYDYFTDHILTKDVDFFKNLSSMRRYICIGFEHYAIIAP